MNAFIEENAVQHIPCYVALLLQLCHMSLMTSQITGILTSSVTSGFPLQRVGNAESYPCHDVIIIYVQWGII